MNPLLTISLHAHESGSAQLGALIRSRRQAAELSLRDLATLCGTGVRFLGELERGKPNVDLHLVLRVLDALGLVLAVHEQENNSRVGPP